jgi:phosphoesterase RecJ-like protein
MSKTEVLDALYQHQRILCVSHVSPDGDAYGSLLGMGWLLRQLGKQPVLAMQDKAPREFQHLPGISAILPASAVGLHYDLMVVLDTSSLDRVGTVYRPEHHGRIPLMVIDHHVTNAHFGQINWVMPTCAATCQMLVYLADALQIPLTGPLAECLLTGIVTDTLCFRTSNTDAAVMEAALRLMKGGANLLDVTQRALPQRSMALFRLWGMLFSHLTLEEGVIWTTISQEELKRAGDLSTDGQLSSMLITAVEADISATFTEKSDEKGRPKVECSFRAKPGFDVAKVALAFGGGGHPAASGCTLPGSLAEAIPPVLAALKAARRQPSGRPQNSSARLEARM